MDLHTNMWRTLLLPAAVVVAAVVLSVLPGENGPLVESVPAYIPYGVALIGILMGWRFHRTRAVFILIVLALVYWAMSDVLTAAPRWDPFGRVLYPAIALLLPFNLMFFAWSEERGLMSVLGLSRLAFIALQVGLLVFAVREAAPDMQADLGTILHWRIFPSIFGNWTPLPQPAVIVFVLAGFGLVSGAALRPGALEAGLLMALFAAGLGLHHIGAAPAPELYLTAAMAAVTLAVVQESYHMAFLDDLTGLPGRRALMQEMKHLRGAYAVAMVDVDHFKKFNDRHGHDTGDQVLKMVAGSLSRAHGAKAFRYGGEEFTLLYPGLDAKMAKEALETVRLSVEEREFHLRGKDRPKKRPKKGLRRGGRKAAGLSATVSIGVASHGPAGESPEEVLKAADHALYGAKRAGRNRVKAYRARRREQK